MSDQTQLLERIMGLRVELHLKSFLEQEVQPQEPLVG